MVQLNAKELIEKLAEFPPETIVSFVEPEWGHIEVEKVVFVEGKDVWTTQEGYSCTPVIEFTAEW